MFHRSVGVTTISGWIAAPLVLAILVAGCGGDKEGAGATGAPDAKTTAAQAASAPLAASVAPPMESAGATPSADPVGSADAPAPSASAGAKVFDCGAKGQKTCPMQAWMKRVMAGAASSGDGDKLAEALTYVANHPPPGFAAWPALAREGARKAKAGDIDGAKAACKQCHDQFKTKYRATLRDRPF